MTWVLGNLDLIWSLTLAHLWQSLAPIVLGFAISLPLGWIAWRTRLLRSGTVIITGLLYTIPSLALLTLLPELLGLPINSEANLIAALTIYAVALLVRSVVDGLDSVDPAVRLAATATGFGAARRFWTVELPLAGPVLLAGLRVTAASTVALATVGILVGVTNLGYLFTNGLQRRIIPEVLIGILVVAAIAVVIDLLLLLAGRALMPWQRATRGRPARVPVESGVTA